jgi:cellulose synthase/poly-beta-1,6-N-acetylglucosamine synthase-like glycosyltransferase
MLAAFALRRLLLLAAAIAPSRPLPTALESWPTVTLVVPAHNEAAGIDATLNAIEGLDYPDDRISIVLVDDHSSDATAEHLERWARNRSRARALRLERRVGKPGAVEAGMRAAPPSRLLAICDADVRLRPDYLRRVASAFSDETTGGAVGYLLPVNALTSAVASYAAVESWIHQLVTSAGKDRLDLNPPTLGGAPVFRRTALESIGGLGSAPSGDDVRATVALTCCGWRTRFLPDAVAENEVAGNLSAYWRQHMRWAHDLYATATDQRSTSARISLSRRIEAWMLSVGYLDRVVLVAAMALVATGRLSIWVPVAYLSVAAVEVAWAVIRAGAARHLPIVCVRTAAVFPLDVAGSLLATARHLVRTHPRASLRGAPQH